MVACIGQYLPFMEPRLTGPKLTSCDTETGVEVVDDSKQGRLPLQLHPVCGDEADHGHNDDEGGVEPVDVLVPVAPGDGLVGDVRLGQVGTLSRATHGFVVGCAIGTALGLGGRGYGG